MSSGFISENELAEARKRRQEEWEKVRTAEEPIERPDEPYDCRSLYERLREQKIKSDLEYEESHKLKNLIRGLDDDEVQFLELVDKNKIDAEKKKLLEDREELKEFRNRVITLQEESIDKKILAELKQTKPKNSTSSSLASSRPSQKSLLGIGIKRKSQDTKNTIATASVSNAKRAATAMDNNEAARLTKEGAAATTCSNTESNGKSHEPSAIEDNFSVTTNQFDRGALKCIAVLPGIGPYHDSSDSEDSSGSEAEPEIFGKYDLVGRKIKKKKQCQEDA